MKTENIDSPSFGHATGKDLQAARAKPADPQLLRRYNREAQARHRGQAASPKSDLENALLLLAWEAVELSEGQVATMLDMDRVSLRIMRESFIKRGMEFAQSLADAKLNSHRKTKGRPARAKAGARE